WRGVEGGDSSLWPQQRLEPRVCAQHGEAGLNVRIEKANLVHVSRVERTREQVHSRVALAQARCDARAPVGGLSAPERSLESDQQPVDAGSRRPIATLRGQDAEQPGVLLRLRVGALELF